MQCSICREKRKFTFALVRQALATVNNNDSNTPKLIGDRESFDGSINDVNSRFLFLDEEQLKGWRKLFTTVFNCKLISFFRESWKPKIFLSDGMIVNHSPLVTEGVFECFMVSER